MEPSFFILYVAEMSASVAFYTDLFGGSPIETSEHFTMFSLKSGVLFALWQQDDVAPAATAPGGIECCLPVASSTDVDATMAVWRERGIRIEQQPMMMDFGYTFVGLDPDGHRLRVFAPAERAHISSARLEHAQEQDA